MNSSLHTFAATKFEFHSMFSCTTNRIKLDIAKSSKQHVDGLEAALVLLPILDHSYTPGVPPLVTMTTLPTSNLIKSIILLVSRSILMVPFLQTFSCIEGRLCLE
jgi:hypothetical protein